MDHWGMRARFLAIGCLILTCTCRCISAAANQETNAPGAPGAPGPGFRINRAAGRYSLRTPDGRDVISRGVCVVAPGPTRADYDPENPAYAWWKYYEQPSDWADVTLHRLKRWGFTTLGAWSDLTVLRSSPEMDLWFTPVLHMGSTAGAPWWDMWDEKVTQRMEDTARTQILAVRDDPRLIGYYSDNELGWWNASLFHMTLQQAAESEQRRRLIGVLRAQYNDDWQALVRDFEPVNLDSWEDLEAGGLLYLRSGGQGIVPMRTFLRLIAERYYGLVHQFIRNYDRRALILGDRYQSFFYPEVAAAAAPYVDAISSNLNAHWSDGTFLRCYLDTLHALTARPIVVSEIYLAAAENRSGNRNDDGVFPVVQTQRQRAAGVQRTLAALERSPFVIGMDWFQYTDEPAHGRFDGENFNFGLVDTQDQPYVEVTRAFAQNPPGTFSGPAHAHPNRTRPDARLGIPRAPRDPFANFTVNLALQHWDRERGFVPATSLHPLADLYASWNRDALFLGLYALDVVEDLYYWQRHVSKVDRPAWTIEIPGLAQPIRARIGAGREALVNDPSVRVESLSGVNHNVRCIAIMRIPAHRFKRTVWRPGDAVTFKTVLETHARATRVEWSGQFRLRQ